MPLTKLFPASGRMFLISGALQCPTLVRLGAWQKLDREHARVDAMRDQRALASRGHSTGWSTGPHLHFEVRHGDVPVDPMPYLLGQSAI